MDKLCLGCMKLKPNIPVCEYCGFDERTENQPHQLPIGTILQNQYLVGRVLGQGGFGITYIGWDQHLSIPVAIKEYYPGGVVHRNTQWGTNVTCDNGAAPEVYAKHRERFLKEARTLAQLSGIPEIVQIKSFFPENGTAYIVMEYVEGITLKDHLKRLGRPMTETEALAIMEPVLKALQKVHDQGLIHRDISPDNIMLPKSGGVKLIDFGTVRYMDDSGKSKSTEAVLKPGFAPMEQYNTRGNLGTWTDVYAICATFHYLLTGKVPADVHDRMEQGESLKLLRSRSSISQKLISALEKGMKLRIQERVQTIAELYQLLYSGKKKPAVPKQQEIKKLVPEKKTKKKGKSSLLAACTAAAVAVGVAAMLLILKAQTPQAQLAVPETTAAPIQDTTIPTTLPLETTEAVTAESIAYAEAEALSAQGMHAQAGIAFAKLGEYRDAHNRSFEEWGYVRPMQTVAGGFSFRYGAGVSTYFICLKEDGTAIMKGDNTTHCQSISGWRDLSGVCMLRSIPFGIKSDGTVVSGPAISGERDIALDTKKGAEILAEQTKTWTDIIYLRPLQNTPGFGFNGILGLKRDGTVVFAGTDEEETRQVNACISTWTNIVDLPLDEKIVGLKSDGTVVAYENYISDSAIATWKDIVSVKCSDRIIFGISVNGTVQFAGEAFSAGVGYQEYNGKLDGLTDVVDLASYAALKTDGTVVPIFSFGFSIGPAEDYAWIDTVKNWTNITQLHGTSSILYGLKADGTVDMVGENMPWNWDVSDWTDAERFVRSAGSFYVFNKDGLLLDLQRGKSIDEKWKDFRLPQ